MAKPIKSLHKQQGLTMMGWASAILLFAFAITCAYRVAPPYFDNWQIQSALESLGELDLRESAYEGASDAEIRSHISRFFTVNNVSTDRLKDVKITRNRGRVYVDLNWEVRNPLFYNIDVVLSFENQFDSLNPGDCCKPQANTTQPNN